MLPFPKRPAQAEEIFLASGDFEALPSVSLVGPLPAPPPSRARSSYAPPSVAPHHGVRAIARPMGPMPVQRLQPHPAMSMPLPAPPPPAFARQPSPTPYGYAQQNAYAHQGDLSVSIPPAPHSLAPLAMDRSFTGASSVTSSQRSQTIVVRERPSFKWGVMIALSGALFGGVLGLGMDAKQTRASAAAMQAPASAPVMQNSVAASPVAPVMAAPVVVAPVMTAMAPSAVVAPPVLSTASIIASAPPVAPKPEKHTKAAPAKHGTFVAAKVPAQGKPAAAEKEPAPVKPKPEPAEKPAKGDKPSPSEAQRVLDDARKDTTNTL
ncbi:MAG: hypothetical protein JWP97_5284 [Labilithrix sp.]|nr:hypothetical protein [Labilithrix sp.]